MDYRRLLRSILPASVVYRLGDIRARFADRRYASMAVQETFEDIYRRNGWGGEKGQAHSGEGSANQDIVRPYIRVVSQVLSSIDLERRTVVDLGCGDFRIAEPLFGQCLSYVGIDVVPHLIAQLQGRSYPRHVTFRRADIIEDELPHATVCLLRQVLQHLSNSEIARVLPKLRSFEHVIVTEHFPARSRFLRPNADKAHGPGIRASQGSAVCLDEPPFNVRGIVQLLEVPGDGCGRNADAGVIRTVMFPGAAIPAA